MIQSHSQVMQLPESLLLAYIFLHRFHRYNLGQVAKQDVAIHNLSKPKEIIVSVTHITYS